MASFAYPLSAGPIPGMQRRAGCLPLPFQLLDLYAHQAERILLHKRNEERLYEATETLERSVTRKQVLLMERDARLAQLMSELLLTEERERRELVAALHDSLAQLLSMATMKLSLVRASLVRPAEKRNGMSKRRKKL